MTVTDEQHRLAILYVGDYWAHDVDKTNFVSQLDSPFVPDEDDLDPEYWGGEIMCLAGTPLRTSLRIDDTMLDAMKIAYENYWRKLSAQYSDPAGWNDRYERQVASVVMRSRYDGNLLEMGPFYNLASCQGGDEVDLIFMHPRHGIDKRISVDEYRIRTSPYVAAFGLEVYPGDLESGLVHHSVQNKKNYSITS